MPVVFSPNGLPSEVCSPLTRNRKEWAPNSWADAINNPPMLSVGRTGQEYSADLVPRCFSSDDDSSLGQRSYSDISAHYTTTSLESSARDIFATCKTINTNIIHKFMEPTPFFQLSEAIRTKIFKYLPTRDRVMAQMVCRTFRFEIRVRCGVAAFVNEKTTWGMTFCRDVICDTVAVGRFHNPYLSPNGLILKGKMIENLLFVGPISISNVDAFLNKCNKLTRLTFQCPISEKSPPHRETRLKKDFKSFRRLDAIRKNPPRLWNCRELEICPTGKIINRPKTIQYALEMCRYVHLRKIVIKCGTAFKLEDTKGIHLALFEFIIRNPFLQYVICNCMVNKDEQKPVYKINLLRPEREILEMSKKVQLKQLSLTEEMVNFHLWCSFMLEQRNLETLQVMHLMMFPVLIHVINNNNETLTRISLHCALMYDSGTRKGRRNMFMDLAVFGDCTSLKELFFAVAGPFDPETTDITNFRQLPKTLEVFGMRNVTFNSKDFLGVVELPKLRSLGVVAYAGTGISSHNLSARVCQSIMQIRSMDELLLQGFTLTGGVRQVFFMGRNINGLTSGQLNCLYVGDKKKPNSNRWVLSKDKSEYVFRLFEDRTFEA